MKQEGKAEAEESRVRGGVWQYGGGWVESALNYGSSSTVQHTTWNIE